MKYILLLLLVPLFSVAQKTNTEDFLGKWAGKDKGEIGYITFDEQNIAFIEIDGQLMGGKEFLLKEEKFSLTYKINTEAKPITVDFILTNLASDEQRTLFCIAEFKDPNTMQFAINFADLRPEDFTEKNSIILTRVD
jgi:hypothetical protein